MENTKDSLKKIIGNVLIHTMYNIATTSISVTLYTLDYGKKSYEFSKSTSEKIHSAIFPANNQADVNDANNIGVENNDSANNNVVKKDNNANNKKPRRSFGKYLLEKTYNLLTPIGIFGSTVIGGLFGAYIGIIDVAYYQFLVLKKLDKFKNFAEKIENRFKPIQDFVIQQTKELSEYISHDFKDKINLFFSNDVPVAPEGKDKKENKEEKSYLPYTELELGYKSDRTWQLKVTNDVSEFALRKSNDVLKFALSKFPARN